MTQQADQSSDERWRQRDERSRLLLKQIDQLDDAIAATADKKLRGNLQRESATIGRSSRSIWTTEPLRLRKFALAIGHPGLARRRSALRKSTKQRRRRG